MTKIREGWGRNGPRFKDQGAVRVKERRRNRMPEAKMTSCLRTLSESRRERGEEERDGDELVVGNCSLMRTREGKRRNRLLAGGYCRCRREDCME